MSILNDCVHGFVFCECDGICHRYTTIGSKEGTEILANYKRDTENAIKKVTEEYRKKYGEDKE